jgi:hypothetical protein
MAMSASSHCSTTSLRAFSVLLSVFAALVADVGGRHHVLCPPFSCGGFSNVSYPFRRQGDPHGCGVQSYELVCTETSATIRIGSGTYNVLSINYTLSHFWVVDSLTPTWACKTVAPFRGGITEMIIITTMATHIAALSWPASVIGGLSL